MSDWRIYISKTAEKEEFGEYKFFECNKCHYLVYESESSMIACMCSCGGKYEEVK